MRWFLRSLVALALLWAVYLLSPYVALYNLAKAVEARDVALIGERVDFPALRLSLARQVAAAYAKAVAPPKDGRSPASGSASNSSDLVSTKNSWTFGGQVLSLAASARILLRSTAFS